MVERELPMKLLWVRQGPYPAIQSNDAHRALRASWAAGREISQRIWDNEWVGKAESGGCRESDDEGMVGQRLA